MQRGTGFLVSAVVAMMVLVLAAPGASDTPRRGGTLTMAIQKDLTLMNPLVATRSTDQSIRELMFEPLLGIDLTGKLQPNLAESWSVSRDGKVYTFRLRPARFHNGQEMTAEDVKFAIDYTMDPKNRARDLNTLEIIQRAEITDKHTIRLVLIRDSVKGFASDEVRTGTMNFPKILQKFVIGRTLLLQ